MDQSRLASGPLLVIALLQGLALLLLHQAIEMNSWPMTSPPWLFFLYSVSFTLPTMLLLSLSETNKVCVLKWVLGFSLLVSALAYYVGLQLVPSPSPRYSPLLFAMISTFCVASFKTLMYVQIFSDRESLSYSRLFKYSWRNFLTLGLSLLFALCVWGVLMLWAALFSAIKIDFFHDLFTERWFYYPTLALANGFGVILFRQQSQIIDTITRIQQALMKFLLVILGFVSIIFLLALPFTGLAPLWETGGSYLILWMQVLMLFFLNAVYQDDPDKRPYALWLHRFIYIAIALLPIYSLISFYGLSLRVEQYGWTVLRCWGFLMWSVLFLFSLGYVWGIVRQRDDWLHRVSWVNVRMGLVVLMLMLLVNSPLLDFRKISVASQLARLEAGAVTLERFDYQYFYRDLARPGYDALQMLAEKHADEYPDMVNRIKAFSMAKISPVSEQQFVERIHVVEGVMPADLGNEIYRMVSKHRWRMINNIAYYLIPADMNRDGEIDYLLVEERAHYLAMTLFYREGDQWQRRGLSKRHTGDLPIDSLVKSINEGSYTIEPPVWQQFKLGRSVYQVE